jgi:predicted transcriptional regulator
MDLPCETVGRHILPVFRSYVAKQLVENYGFTQEEVAERLGTTQAAVSQYIHSKRGNKSATLRGDSLSIIESAAIDMAKTIATREIDHDQIPRDLCKMCKSLWERRRPIRNRLVLSQIKRPNRFEA